jgi:ubiquinone/menaquinone biosynthesis C-methylase UbiE
MIASPDMPHPRLKYVDYQETYGRHLLDQWSQSIKCEDVLDLGCGSGSDLMIVRRHHPEARFTGVEYSDWAKSQLSDQGIHPITVDLEREALPFASESMDLIIANQILYRYTIAYWAWWVPIPHVYSFVRPMYAPSPKEIQ